MKQNKPLQCDTLVIGGGIAGLMGAIAAAENMASVIVAEKADTRRSGSGATGNDHFLCYIPEYHGNDIAPILKEMDESQIGGCNDRELLRIFAARSFDLVKEWHSYGIDMKPTGKWEFTGHAKPGRPRIWLKYAGYNQKEMLTKQALKMGAVIKNKMPLADIIVDADNKIIGAVCIDISDREEPGIQIIYCKSIILATGNTSRLYSPRTAACMFNVANCPACTGTGRAAYKSRLSFYQPIE